MRVIALLQRIIKKLFNQLIMYKKAKKTFLMSAGRKGAPSAIAPRISVSTKKPYAVGGIKMSRKPAVTPVGKAKVVRNGRPLATRKLKGKINSFNMSKAPKMPARGRKDLSGAGKSFYMSRKPKGRSATRSPQSAPVDHRPQG